ncbi:RHS repeat-associated core domain-containing protein [Pseudomonas asplenii]|uniref:RHS repeat-associated core domain-containing protein n=1 Tax=Pseudomonas asplenii TaxID=53407 RepID=UPI0006CD3E73|nr:RHS repeat-associated core domain-containing protein [Pseudomonas fuscovaginae]KPA97213.1 RHS repeat-associated core domain [Pseudomonas fuscovaginae]
MPSTDRSLLCRYRYDPLDRLTDYTPSVQANTQRFYLKDRLSTEIQGAIQRSIFQQEDQLLAQQQRQGGAVETTLLATDQQRSVLHALDATQPHPIAYTPYGHRPPENGLLSLLGFNGERPDPVTGHYLLGNGYRAFNPVLMRFNSPDSLSPFGEGGLNAYAYCEGDPVNFSDPTGRALAAIRAIIQNSLNFFDDMITATGQAVTRGMVPAESIPIERRYLKTITAADPHPAPYVYTLANVNDNLASHGNKALTMPQAKALESIVQQVNAGKISNTTAHLREAGLWAEKFFNEPTGTHFAGAFLNFAAAGVRGVADKNMRVTGLSLRRGSAFTHNLKEEQKVSFIAEAGPKGRQAGAVQVE